MDGIQLIRLLDVLQVTSFENAIGVSPRSLIVRGINFKDIASVLINGANSPMYVAYSETELIAEVPEDISDSIITEVVVLSGVPTMTNRSVIELTVGPRVRHIAGQQRLVQTFIRQLLRTTGSNIFHKTSGGSLVRRIGSNIDERVAADVAVAVNNAKQYIIAQQTSVPALPSSERLMSAEIAGISVDPNNASVYVTLILTTQSGQRSAATLVA